MKFSKANAKIEALANHPTLSKYLDGKRKVYSFDLLSGYSCPFAEKCLSKAVLVDGRRKIKDGAKNQFRCFSASQEVQYTNVYNSRKANFDALRNMQTSKEMQDAIQAVMPKNTGIVRIHVAGDFFNAKYFNAWVRIESNNPDVLFYAYTKSLKFWLHTTQEIPYNMVLTASRGGRDDNLISEHNLRESVVVYSEAEAAKLGLDIDHDDSHAADPTQRHRDFALLIHGTQPKGSEAAEALKQLKRNNVKHSYSRKAVNV